MFCTTNRYQIPADRWLIWMQPACCLPAAGTVHLQLLLEALFNARSTRESIRDPGTKKASLTNFCKECSHQTVFGNQIGVLLAVSTEDVKVDHHPVSIASQALTLALREGWKTWWADGDGSCFWRSLSLAVCRSQRFYRQEKLVVLASTRKP